MINMKSDQDVAETLRRLYLHYTRKSFLRTDPVVLVHRYSSPQDIECTGFLVSLFSLGRIESILNFCSSFLTRLGNAPYENLGDGKGIENFVPDRPYRFFSREDVVAIFQATSQVIRENGSVESVFQSFYSQTNRNLKRGTEQFMLYMRQLARRESHGIKVAFPLPSTSACKRWLLFLRWMVRKDNVDFGIWKSVNPSELIIPLDVHVFRAAQRLGLTTRRSASWAAAAEITEKLKKIDPTDPVKYDFALVRVGYFEYRRSAYGKTL